MTCLSIPDNALRVGVDIGGTFTDVVFIDDAGEIRIEKVPTVPIDPSDGFINGLVSGFRRHGLSPRDVEFLVHGTTIATNTIIQGVGARVGLIASEGFSDVLEIAYQIRPSLYDLNYRKLRPLVPRHMSVGVPERMGYDGAILRPLDVPAAVAAAGRLIEEGAEAIVVAFLHSYVNAAHENAAKAAIADAFPNVPVVASAEVCAEFREYARTSTAIVNASLLPKVGPYLTSLAARIEAMGLSAGLNLMTSAGGICTEAAATLYPVQLVESGPAAGVLGAAFAAQTAGFSDILALDMGGTTAKVSVVDKGVPELADEFEVGAVAMPSSTASRGHGYPVKMPVISLVEIGAGGGSIAGIDPGGALVVGPLSAGAHPGPAAYDRGGTHPTVTDANIALGRIDPDFFLGGELPLRRDLAETAIHDHVARPLGIGIQEAALAVIRIANAKMVAAMDMVTTKRGLDPRAYRLVVSGGAAPLHAADLAAAMRIDTVLVPPTPGVNSAVGLLATDIKQEFVRSFVSETRATESGRVAAIFDELQARGRDFLLASRVAPAAMRFRHEADMCYRGQSSFLRIPIDLDGEAPLDAAEAAFHETHHRTFGLSSPGATTRIVSLRLTAVGLIPRPAVKRLPAGDGDISRAQKGVRPIYFEGHGAIPTRIYRRDGLAASDIVSGPAVVEQFDTTILIPPGIRAEADPAGNLLIHVAGKA